jgi:hypothetical protein
LLAGVCALPLAACNLPETRNEPGAKLDQVIEQCFALLGAEPPGAVIARPLAPGKPLAGLLKEKERYAGLRAATILSGANIDCSLFVEVLSGRTPQV